MTNFPRLLEALVNGGVEFVIIGRMAATAHGSAHVTVDSGSTQRQLSADLTLNS